MAKKTQIVPADRALIGTWITNEEDSDVAVAMSAAKGTFLVSAFGRGQALSFVARLPSTDYTTKNVLRLRPDGKADLELTLFEVWKKKDVSPGQIPEAWQASRRGLPPDTHLRRARSQKR